MAGLIHFFRHGGRIAWALIVGFFLVFALSTGLLATTADVRYQRDVTRMVFNNNLDLLEDVKREVGVSPDSLDRVLASDADPAPNAPFVVVSIAENRLWYKKGDSVLFATRVATGSGKTMVGTGSGRHYKFDTPRGRLVVERKDVEPAWVPPDWHYDEQARKRGLGLQRLNRGESIPTADGGVVTVAGSDVVKQLPDGRQVPLEATDGREIVVNGKIVIPPFGTNQRKYKDVLGTHRLYLGDGYGIHGTNNPASIGQSVSHGCIRVRNEDIQTLYEIVPLGTPVYIY
jgi:lipoprotein-anchoring transpeptidase ErfK/SrfK